MGFASLDHIKVAIQEQQDQTEEEPHHFSDREIDHEEEKKVGATPTSAGVNL